jgi:hypothetical protein
MRHMMAGENLALITSRLTKGETFAHTQVTRRITEVICMSPKTSNNGFVFPLYLYPAQTTGQTTGSLTDVNRRPNLSPAFLKALAEKLNQSQTEPHGLLEGITPEDIFHYAYAVFHSPTYRTRYAEFLKMDFPRLPLTSSLELFGDLAALSEQLVALHLLDADAIRRAESPSLPDGDDKTRRGQRHCPTALFPVSGGNEVEKVRYEILRFAQNDHPPSCHSERSEESPSGRVYINKTQYFDTVPPEVWEFHIGGYQVCDKWLKDRKGRKLTIDDIQHYQRIVVALRETIRLMAEIDERIPGFPMG